RLSTSVERLRADGLGLRGIARNGASLKRKAHVRAERGRFERESAISLGGRTPPSRQPPPFPAGFLTPFGRAAIESRAPRPDWRHLRGRLALDQLGSQLDQALYI